MTPRAFYAASPVAGYTGFPLKTGIKRSVVKSFLLVTPGETPSATIACCTLDGALAVTMIAGSLFLSLKILHGSHLACLKRIRIESGQREPRLPSAHRTVLTGPYTAPHVTFIH